MSPRLELTADRTGFTVYDSNDESVVSADLRHGSSVVAIRDLETDWLDPEDCYNFAAGLIVLAAELQAMRNRDAAATELTQLTQEMGL